MKRPTTAQSGVRGLLGVTLVVSLLLGACKSDSDRSGNDEGRQSSEKQNPPAQIVVENGQRLIVIDSATQTRLGLTISTLTLTTARNEAALPAVILPVQDLATFRSGYITAGAQVQKARIEADTTSKEYARLKKLSEDNQNVSQKSLEAAQAAADTSQADVHEGEQLLTAQAMPLKQQWGEVIAHWATQDSEAFENVLDQRDTLMQLTLPAEDTFPPPKMISVEAPEGRRVQASFISSFPRVDPRIQGRSFVYLAPMQPGFAPGMNLLARFPMGNQIKGIAVPVSAVVWVEGEAWAYVEVTDGRFSRRSVATQMPIDDGFFTAEGFSPGDKIVTSGAQALLSQELLLHAVGGDED